MNSNAQTGGAAAGAVNTIVQSHSHPSLQDNVLTIKTVQIAPFRTLMCAMKEILIETNITFQKDGMRIINMDKSHTMLAHLFLESVNFELYECALDKIIIGVNMFHLEIRIKHGFNCTSLSGQAFNGITF